MEDKPTKKRAREEDDDEKWFALLRSPHLSKNELAMMRPFIPNKNDLHRKYFGHLKGIIMVSYYSNVPLVLAGADFDGDLVKIINDEDINTEEISKCIIFIVFKYSQFENMLSILFTGS